MQIVWSEGAEFWGVYDHRCTKFGDYNAAGILLGIKPANVQKK